MTARHYRVCLRLSIGLVLFALSSPTFATVLRFEFTGDRSGRPGLRFAGQGFVDREAFRYDYGSGNHPLFREGTSIRSADGGRILAVIDNREGTYFYRATETMSGVMSNFRVPWQKEIESHSVVVENLGREESIGGLQLSRMRITIGYRTVMEFDGERLSADITSTAELVVAPKYRIPALPWGHQFALKTGWPDLDERIAREVVRLGFPIEQTVEVTRTIEGGVEDTEHSTFRVVGLREVAFTTSGFSPPPGYRALEPSLVGPSITDTGEEHAALEPTATNPEAQPAVVEPARQSALEVLEPGASPIPFVETMEVRVINIDVVVRDRAGRPVSGLTPVDFEVLENGQAVEITNLVELSPSRGQIGERSRDEPESAEGGSTRTSDEPLPQRRKIVLFFDQNALHPAHRRKLIPAMRQFVNTAMRPGDETMIASFSNGLRLDLQLTSNREVVLQMVDRMEERLSLSQTRASQLARSQQLLWDHILDYEALGGPPPYETGIAECRAYADTVTHDANMVIASLKTLITGLDAIDGRKILVFATESLPARPGNEIFTFFNGIKHFFAGGQNQQPLAETQRYDLTPKISELAEAANQSGFTLYPIQAQTLSAGFAPLDLTSTMAVRFTESAAGVEEMRKMSDAEGLQAVARLTGGIATLGANDFTPAFQSIVEDLESYYSLGYHAGQERTDFVRSIKVRMKDPSLIARARHSIVDRSIETRMEEYVAANLFYPIEQNDMGITAKASEPQRTVENIKLVLTIEVPTSSLTLIPRDEHIYGKLVVFIGFVSEDGSVSRIARDTREFRFEADTMARRKSISLALDSTMSGSTDRISIGVLDPVSRSTGFASVFVHRSPGD